MAGQLAEGRVVNQPPCAWAAGTARVPPTRPFTRALPRDALVTRVAHCRHTNGTTTRAGKPGGHASETRAAEGEGDDDDDDDEERRGGSGDGGRGRLRWLYVAPNLSRGNYCARNCRSERNPYAARTRHRSDCNPSSRYRDHRTYLLLSIILLANNTADSRCDECVCESCIV